MLKQRVLMGAVAMLAIGCLCSVVAAASKDFEDLTPGTSYGDKASFTSNGLSFAVSSEGSGQISVWGAPNSQFGSVELWDGNAWLDVVLPQAASEVSLDIGYFGGHSWGKVNGVDQYFQYLPDLHGRVVGGVGLQISDLAIVSGGQTATLTMSGTINSLSFFGQEMCMDNLAVTVPEPATLTLAALGGLAMLRRRRK